MDYDRIDLVIFSNYIYSYKSKSLNVVIGKILGVATELLMDVRTVNAECFCEKRKEKVLYINQRSNRWD